MEMRLKSLDSRN